MNEILEGFREVEYGNTILKSEGGVSVQRYFHAKPNDKYFTYGVSLGTQVVMWFEREQETAFQFASKLDAIMAEFEVRLRLKGLAPYGGSSEDDRDLL